MIKVFNVNQKTFEDIENIFVNNIDTNMTMGVFNLNLHIK